ncbi:hypothetical protein [Rhizomonospora bruguierae]|uniref:hypothetical protein n=1 Tax=Rhizomonospora bruguierae TaxID=1581705 RepID=UPI001BCFE8BB|nr:hypothetical protein [Micromonospora sp. NBRC 107566]
MGQGYRQRVAAAASAVALAGVPLLLSTAAPAYADSDSAQESDSGSEVVFDGGGLGLLSCGSRPSVSDLTVPAESTVRFVNRLNQGATLRLDGRDAARVPRGGVRPVLFHRGPVRVEMVPDCLANVGSKYGATIVEVERVDRATPGTTGAPTGAAPSSGAGTGSSAPSPAGSSPGGVPGRRTPGAARTSHGAGDGTGVNPDGTPSAPPSPAAVAAPGDGGSPAAGGATVDENAPQGGWAAEPVAAGEPVGDTGPVGLLALIATVCVVGVSIGTIRAIITKRATRPSWA